MLHRQYKTTFVHDSQTGESLILLAQYPKYYMRHYADQKQDRLLTVGAPVCSFAHMSIRADLQVEVV